MYSAQFVASLTPDQQTDFVQSLTAEQLNSLKYDWRFWARDAQLPPPDLEWFVWLILSGRGYGKTWVGSNYVIEFARHNPRWPIALIGQTKADVRDTMVEMGDSSILKQSPPDFTPQYEPSKRRLTWPNGAVAMIYSGDEPGQLRGPQHGLAWLDELAKFKYARETWDMMEFGLRLGPNPRALVTTTPRPIPVLREIIDDPRARIATGSTFENAANLPARFLERLRDKYEGTRLGRQELYAELLDDVPGALWHRALLERQQHKGNPPDFTRVVVAIDPAVSATNESNETGIVVVGWSAITGYAYVLDDLSGRYAPDEWAKIAVRAYWMHNADRVIAEVNNGGDLVESTIRTVDRACSYKAVRATKGKYTRAEPISALYEQGRVWHVGSLPELEDQLCTWVPGEDSPDRLDALVWGLTELMITPGGWGNLRNTRQRNVKR